MKNMKKIVCVLMALVMVLSMGLSVFADGENNEKPGSIHISKTVPGQTYKIYKLMNVVYDDSQTAFSYTADEQWKEFLNSAEIKGVYVNIDQGHITWVRSIVCGQDVSDSHTHSNSCFAEANAAEFAQKAKKWANDKNIQPVDSKDAVANNPDTPNVDESVILFENLDLGYYLVDSTLGALCSLDTTVPHIDMIEKNGVPTVEKRVKRPDGSLAETAGHEIGDTVEFISKVTIYNGAENLVYHDRMEAGLTLNEDSIKVYYTPVSEGIVVPAENYEIVIGGATNHENHTCEDETCALNGGNCTFEVKFNQSFLDAFTASDLAVEELSIVYTAVLNENAEIVDPDADEESNDNDAKVTSGDNNCSVWNKVKVYTYRFDIVKVDELHKVLSGAKFELYDVDPTTEGAEPIKLVQVGQTVTNDDYEVKTNIYRFAKPDETSVTVDAIEADNVIINGILVDKTYWLKEIQAPAGYNMLEEAVSFTLTGDEAANGGGEITLNEGKWSAGGLHVINKTGAMMPETGGMGTTLFYVVGGILFVGAAVVLITKKRMSNEA